MSLGTREGTYIIVDGIPLMLDQDPPLGKKDAKRAQIAFGFAPQEARQQILTAQDVPVMWRTWHNGMGHSQDVVEGGYSYLLNGCARWSGILVPAGARTEVTVPAQVTEALVDSEEYGAICTSSAGATSSRSRAGPAPGHVQGPRLRLQRDVGGRVQARQ